MLETLHKTLDREVAIFGMNCGTVGFLMNDFDEERLAERLAAAERVTLHPLRMTAVTAGGGQVSELAINEVSLFRQANQAAHIRIDIDGVTRLPELICGSTAYNLSAHGPIVPLGAQLLALTPISAFRPRRWRGALLPNTATVSFEVLNPDKRPVGATADSAEVRDVLRVEVSEARDIVLNLLFDPEHNLEQRVLQEQFAS
jgi:NAD+ kinase